MVGNSKVLTVSYGTFSCTLEGFDDSFDTMKAIAEYFRDLAAQDRYFGAEPPQPDAEVMAQIAAREVARGVQAQAIGDHVTLKATDTSVPTRAIATEPTTPQESAALDDSAVEEDGTDGSRSPSTDTGQEKAMAEEAQPAPLTRAERRALRREKQAALGGQDKDAQSSEHPAKAVIEVTEDDQDLALAASDETAIDEAADDTAPEDLPNAADQTPQSDDQTHDAGVLSSLTAAVKNAAGAATAADDMAAEQPPVAEQTAAEQVEKDEDGRDEDDESLAAKLRRIQAVVGKASAATAATAAAVTVAHVAGRDDDDNASKDSEPTDPPQQDQAASAPVVEDVPAEQARPFRVLKVKKKDLQTAKEDASAGHQTAASNLFEAEADNAPVDLDGLDELTVNLDQIGDDSTLTAEEESDLARELAEVEAITATEDRKAQAVDVAVETVDTVKEDFDLPIGALQDEDESAHHDDAEDVKNILKDDVVQHGHGSGRDVLETQANPEDQSVERLLEKTQAELDQPEARTRRNAISHLKAAVAATVADRRAGGNANAKDEADQVYREDLARVVRPQAAAEPAPTAEQEAQETPRNRTAAPLKLVAEQRVEPEPGPEPGAKTAEATPTPVQSVRPRRVAAKREEPAEAEIGFRGFATEVGADSVPDMLEAAAAYITYVRGNDVFARPQVMRLVQRGMDDGTFSREDGLRAFGTLLRQGRLNKIRGGEFEVTEQTQYQAAAQSLGEVQAAVG